MPFEVVVDEREFRRAPPLQRRELRRLAQRLGEEPALGDRIPRDRVPKRFRSLPNLYRLALPKGWRALYIVMTNERTGDEVRIIWIGDHARHDRVFGY